MKWSKERIWKWYNERPWFRGCNYTSADCINRIDQWQALGFEERLKTTEEEFVLLRETGFNSIRVILEYVVWKEEHDGFMERFERYIALCAKYDISVMVVLANDCMPPKTELWKLPYVGEQEFAYGYFMNRKHNQHIVHSEPAPHFYLDDPETREDYYEMVREIVSKYKDDARICIWDVYNEVGNSARRDISLPLIKSMFEIVREIDPIQPLTACVWNIGPGIDTPECEKYCLENSDIISYHTYGDLNDHVRFIRELKKYERPLMCTEWLGRVTKSDVYPLFPFFYLEKIGCYNWGFVNGMQQTHLFWPSLWTWYEQGLIDIDFHKWFHDLYRGDHHPYDPKEIELIKKYCTLADEDFNSENPTES